MALTLANALTEISREDLPNGVRDMLPSVSGLFKEIKTSWEGVESSLGRPARDAAGNFYSTGWVKRWTIVSAGGGAFKFTNPSPQLIAELGNSSINTPNVATFANTSSGSFPAASDYVFPKFANPYVGLKEGRGVLAFPWQLARANKLENVMLDVLAQNIQQSAEMTALSEAICFFSRNPAWGEIARTGVHVVANADEAHSGVAAESLGRTADTKYLTVSDWWDEDTMTKFRPGMSVDIWEVWWDDSTDDLKILALEANGWVVNAIDPVNQKVEFITKDATAAGNAPKSTGNAASDELCYIFTLQGTAVLAGGTPETGLTLNASLSSTGATETAKMDKYDEEIKAEGTYVAYGMDGLIDFCKTASSQSFYGVNVSRMPNLLSTYIANVNDYLTERKWNAVVGWHQSQYGERFMPDTILTTYGVLNGALQTAFRFEPASPALTHPLIYQNVDRDGMKSPGLKMDFGGIQMGHRGRVFKLYDDPICMRKNLFALKTRDSNLKRLVPPPIPGAGKQPQFQEIEFINKSWLPTIWRMNQNSAGALTDFYSAEYLLTANHYMVDPQMIRLRGLTEAVGLS